MSPVLFYKSLLIIKPKEHKQHKFMKISISFLNYEWNEFYWKSEWIKKYKIVNWVFLYVKDILKVEKTRKERFGAVNRTLGGTQQISSISILNSSIRNRRTQNQLVSNQFVVTQYWFSNYSLVLLWGRNSLFAVYMTNWIFKMLTDS